MRRILKFAKMETRFQGEKLQISKSQDSLNLSAVSG
jgi:hypothetical protein